MAIRSEAPAYFLFPKEELIIDSLHASAAETLFLLSEIRNTCPDFREPISLGDDKLAGMKALMGAGSNIASTHALLYRYDADLLEAIRNAHCTLILDEVVDVIRMPDFCQHDLKGRIFPLPFGSILFFF